MTYDAYTPGPEADPPSQTVVLDDPRTQALFVKPTEPDGITRVFYDLDVLVSTYLTELIFRKVQAQASGNRDLETQIAGAGMLLHQIINSTRMLVADYNDEDTLSSEGMTIKDMFPDE